MTGQSCRYCNGKLSINLANLGRTPLANSYIADPKDIEVEELFPLHVKVCEDCYLAQVVDAVDASSIFDHDYAYLSSYSSSWVQHAKHYSDTMVERFHLKSDSLIMEIASNDGYLLQHFLAKGMNVLGIEPAGHAADVAREKGIDTRVAFFNEQMARNLENENLQADLIAANNVLAHVPDIGNFVAGFKHVLKPSGVLTFEFPHLLNLIKQVQFDTIYHEHYSYISLISLERILQACGLRAFDVEKLDTHGGSLRVFCCLASAPFETTDMLHSVRKAEVDACLNKPEGYAGFSQKVQAVRDGLLNFIEEAKSKNKKIAAYGAAAKGNTFLNYAGITSESIDFVVDQSKEKQGRLLPGSHIPIFSPEKLKEEKPDYILILPWNLRAEISHQHSYVRQWGGQFVIAVPAIEVF
nr:class I SAM-dependent methyltransferase [uncultured Cohaesibacter sp.]